MLDTVAVASKANIDLETISNGPSNSRISKSEDRMLLNTMIACRFLILVIHFLTYAGTTTFASDRPETPLEKMKRERKERVKGRASGSNAADRQRDLEKRRRQLELEDYRTGKKKRDLPPDSPLRIGIKQRPRMCNARSKRGNTLRVHYNGTLYSDGKQVDCSIDREQPFEFVLGAGEVMEGWEKGLYNMCPKEKRRLVIPADLAYGNAGAAAAGGRIHPNATLVYEIELLRISTGTKG